MKRADTENCEKSSGKNGQVEDRLKGFNNLSQLAELAGLVCNPAVS